VREAGDDLLDQGYGIKMIGAFESGRSVAEKHRL